MAHTSYIFKEGNATTDEHDYIQEHAHITKQFVEDAYSYNDVTDRLERNNKIDVISGFFIDLDEEHANALVSTLNETYDDAWFVGDMD